MALPIGHCRDPGVARVPRTDDDGGRDGHARRAELAHGRRGPSPGPPPGGPPAGARPRSRRSPSPCPAPRAVSGLPAGAVAGPGRRPRYRPRGTERADCGGGRHGPGSVAAEGDRRSCRGPPVCPGPTGGLPRGARSPPVASGGAAPADHQSLGADRSGARHALREFVVHQSRGPARRGAPSGRRPAVGRRGPRGRQRGPARTEGARPARARVHRGRVGRPLPVHRRRPSRSRRAGIRQRRGGLGRTGSTMPTRFAAPVGCGAPKAWTPGTPSTIASPCTSASGSGVRRTPGPSPATTEGRPVHLLSRQGGQPAWGGHGSVSALMLAAAAGIHR